MIVCIYVVCTCVVSFTEEGECEWHTCGCCDVSVDVRQVFI